MRLLLTFCLLLLATANSYAQHAKQLHRRMVTHKAVVPTPCVPDDDCVGIDEARLFPDPFAPYTTWSAEQLAFGPPVTISSASYTGNTTIVKPSTIFHCIASRVTQVYYIKSSYIGLSGMDVYSDWIMHR